MSFEETPRYHRRRLTHPHAVPPSHISRLPHSSLCAWKRPQSPYPLLPRCDPPPDTGWKKERPGVSIPSPDESGAVLVKNGLQSWDLQHELLPGAIPLGTQRSRIPGRWWVGIDPCCVGRVCCPCGKCMRRHNVGRSLTPPSWRGEACQVH